MGDGVDDGVLVNDQHPPLQCSVLYSIFNVVWIDKQTRCVDASMGHYSYFDDLIRAFMFLSCLVDDIR